MNEDMQSLFSQTDDSNDENDFNIAELFGNETIVDIMHKIAIATGLAFVTIDYRGNPVAGVETYSSFCQKIQADPERRRICEASSALGIGQAATSQKSYLYFCPCGLLEGAIPIIVRGHFLGGLVGGQIRCRDAPPDTVQLKTVFAHNRDYGKEDFREDYDKMARLSYEKFSHYIELASLIIHQLADKAVSDILQKKYQNEQLMLQKQYHHEQIKLQEEREKRMELESSLKETQLLALRSQMDPYFLMNTLTIISNLAAIEDAPQTNEMIAMFSKFLLNSLNRHTDAEFIFNEMESVECYLRIQKVRLGEKLEYALSVPEEMRLQRIPSMTIFPFVERAFYYGIMQKQEKGKITVSVEYGQDDVVIQVSDDGPGLNKKELEAIFSRNAEEYPYISLDHGVAIARERLIKLFGEEYDVRIKNIHGGGTICVIRYPRSFEGGTI